MRHTESRRAKDDDGEGPPDMQCDFQGVYVCMYVCMYKKHAQLTLQSFHTVLYSLVVKVCTLQQLYYT